MQPSTVEAEDKPTEQPEPALFPIHAAAAVTSAAAVAVLMFADMAAQEPFVPVQARILALGVVLYTLILYLDKRRDERSRQRHDVEMAAIRERNQGAEFIEGYVCGLRRQVPPDEHGPQRPL